MDLGLGELTDDQLLELLQEACRELGRRDPYLRGLAQHTITTEAERTALERGMAQEAVKALAGSYVEQIRQETFHEVKKGVRNGTIGLLTPAQEARVAVESSMEARIRLIDETLAKIMVDEQPVIEQKDKRRPPFDFGDSWDNGEEYRRRILRENLRYIPPFPKPPWVP